MEADHEQRHPAIESETNLGELLQDAGYRTGMIGKWHCGKGHEPKAGFDRWFSFAVAQYPHSGDIRFSDQGEIVTRHGHSAEIFTEEAIDFLRAGDDDRPFFLFVGYSNTHAAHRDQPERLVGRYRRCGFGDIPQERFAPCHGTPRGTPVQDPVWLREDQAQYYAATHFIDEQAGRLVDELWALGKLENTVVVYTADHGHNNGRHGVWGKGNTTIPQNFLEESIRVPMILRDGRSPTDGRTIDVPFDLCDLHATLVELAGAEPDEATRAQLNAPGESAADLLAGRPRRWRDAQFCEYGNARMIRTSRYKLILRYPGPNGRFGDELYDLRVDPRETANVFNDADYATVVAELTDRLNAHFERYEVAEQSGRRIAQTVECNTQSPWALEPPNQGRGGVASDAGRGGPDER
jgi:arylsulfatase A-like enzyme